MGDIHIINKFLQSDGIIYEKVIVLCDPLLSAFDEKKEIIHQWVNTHGFYKMQVTSNQMQSVSDNTLSLSTKPSG